MTRAIRGATTISENTKEQILERTEELISRIMLKNCILPEHVISITFSATRDVTAAYPAVAARGLGLTEAALFCVAEMDVCGSLEKCIRLLMLIEADKPQREMAHVYLHGAKVLRPDLAEGLSSIAIDGPCGSGKSTAAQIIAKKLGYIYVDTGAMYRAVAYYCMKNSKNLKNNDEVISCLNDIDIKLMLNEGRQCIILNGENVTDLIRTQDVAEGSSLVAVIGEVRERLVKLQRAIAGENNVVMDGRDIGSYVLPDATIKVYIDASLEVRTLRRIAELTNKGIPCDHDTVMQEIKNRDHRDKTREISPLKIARDAVIIDTSYMNPEQVATHIISLMANIK